MPTTKRITRPATMRPAAVLGAALLAGLALLPGCAKKNPVSAGEVVVRQVAALPADPADRAWSALPEHTARLLLQDLVEPRLMTASTVEVRVRAASNGTEVAFRLEWADGTTDDTPGAARFSDACAVQLPAAVAANVPAPQMGEPGRRVEITLWKAAWQATVDGRPDNINALYPNASVDHYPFDAASLGKGTAAAAEMARRYAPARALGNDQAGPREQPVEDLLAEGPGTIARADAQVSRGKGVRTPTGWAVVITRRLPAGFTAGTRSDVAFAVWEGGREEVGARKMRTGWIPLALQVSS